MSSYQQLLPVYRLESSHSFLEKNKQTKKTKNKSYFIIIVKEVLIQLGNGSLANFIPRGTM